MRLFGKWNFILIKLTKVLKKSGTLLNLVGEICRVIQTKQRNAARFVLLMCKSTAHQNNGRIYMNLYFFRCIIWYVSVHSFKNLLKRRRNTDECHHVTATCVSYLVFFFIRLHSLTLHKTHFIKILSTHGLRSDNGFGARACVSVW